ncbi:zinc finger protein 62 homolog [Myxocyprinus asiaticus]|uniref:zinc finger protein 62 homolog n=1 Tax=Myxocyprinus asiaticus TaxID=70543 RepID=UPI0022231015|nr:zinc finger protein 62 homolog [Myxocyprinus asiaticus]
MGKNPILSNANSSNSENLDSVACRGDQTSVRPRHALETLSKLAQLITGFEHRAKPFKSSSFICKDCSQTFSDLSGLVCHQKRDHALQKLHRCQHCGQKFALLSSLQLHKCPSASSMCQECRGKPQWDSPCPTCGTEPSGPHGNEKQDFYRDKSPYVCTLCGLAFGHKQELLYHQQAGGCQPTPLSPKALTISPPDAPSHASSPPSPACTSSSLSACTLCPRTFKSPAGLSNHLRNFHSPKKLKKKKKDLTSDTTFPCRTCDKDFPQTSLLYLHRKEENQRETMVRKPQRNDVKATRGRHKSDTYLCHHCGKVFLHHLTLLEHFQHYRTHHQAHLALSAKLIKASRAGKRGISNAAKGCKPSKESKFLKEGKCRGRGRPRTKSQPVLKDSKEEVTDNDEDDRYPCASCEEVFRTQAALKAHESIHPEVDTCKRCSVCTCGIPLSQIPEEKNVYHCVPCAEAFIALDTFLEHCQKHLCDKEYDED